MPELYVYALAPGRIGGIGIRGITGETLQAIRIGRVAAIVGRVRVVPPPTVRNLRRHAEVMTALWQRTPALLPARFGTSAHDLDDLRTMVRPRERTLRRGLRSVRNRAQMTVRLVTGEQADMARPAKDQSGTQYMRARQRERTVPAFEALRPHVRRWVREERVEKHQRVATIYHLVPRAAAEPYRAALERAAPQAGLTLMVSGPFPPYAFADPW